MTREEIEAELDELSLLLFQFNWGDVRLSRREEIQLDERQAELRAMLAALDSE